ncbi:heterokaryon incompatibility protein-domain-containing protein [Xylariaceae sp. FL1651]|nr:heterokaryon incompatibility protein-domain-containing protein [Xylariaceae sp. FL1651]
MSSERYVYIEDSGIYKSIPLSKDPGDSQIRILEILPGEFDNPLKCNLSVASIGSVPYEALSYRWKGVKGAKVHVDKANCLIQENLASALRYLRYSSESRFIWCDAICIHQSNQDEKDHQLLLMGKIYRCAEVVLVWLGEPTSRSDSAMEYFEKYPGPEWCGGLPLEISTRLSYDTHHTWWLYFGDELLSTDWWGRAWMVQEMVLAKKLIFVCGKYQMQESAFFSIAMSGTVLNRNIFTQPASHGEMSLRQIAWQSMMYQRLARQGGFGNDLQFSDDEIGYDQDGISSPRADIGFWIGQFHGWGSTDPKDRVYAYLALDEDCPIQPSKLAKDISFTQLYRLVTEYVLTTTGGLDFICLGRAHPRQPGLPSWVPDFSKSYGTNPALPPANFGLRTSFKASNGRLFEGTFEDLNSISSQRVLKIVARHVGRIKEVTEVHRADNEVECIEHSIKLASWGSGPRYEESQYEYTGKRSHSRYAALNRTLVWNLNYERRPCSESEGFFADVVASRVPVTYNQELLGSLPEDLEHSFSVDSVLYKFKYRLGRRTALLDNGFIGMVPEACILNSHDGSSYEVYILAGASFPMVLRRLPERNGRVIFELIGECYVHGVMDGEVYQSTSIQDVEIVLV